MENITKVSDKAFAVMATCDRTKQSYGITVDPVNSRELKLVWAFKIDKTKAHREGYDKVKVRGGIVKDDNFPGCPYCGTKDFYVCGNCNAIVCYHGERTIVCPCCGNRGEIEIVESIELQGGGL